ncbi:MAG: hypothetical protein ACOH1V_13330 [Stenotrophomonas sp.]
MGNDDLFQRRSLAMTRALQRPGVSLQTLFFNARPALALPHECPFNLALAQARHAFNELSDLLRLRLASQP